MNFDEWWEESIYKNVTEFSDQDFKNDMRNAFKAGQESIPAETFAHLKERYKLSKDESCQFGERYYYLNSDQYDAKLAIEVLRDKETFRVSACEYDIDDSIELFKTKDINQIEEMILWFQR